MEQVAPVESGSSRWRAKRLGVALSLLIIVALVVGSSQLWLWAVSVAFAAPLTLVALVAMLLLPGLALLRLTWPCALATSERWPLAIGISCALPPILLLVSEPLGLHWNGWLCWAYLALSLLVLLWPARGTSWRHTWRRGIVRRPDTAHLLLLVITLAAVVVRLYAARDLPVGMFGDSYHHTMIAQLLIDHGGLFSSWQPYAPLKTFTYHYGFHSNVAWLGWLSGEPVTRGVLVIGQVQSALAVPLAYLFTRRLFNNRRAGLWAALIVGFLSAMPAYYVNWGRYTQLAGQTVLPVVCIIWMALLEMLTERSAFARWYDLLRLLVLTVIVTSGLILTHYRVAVFAACFVVAYALYLLITRVRAFRAGAALVGGGLVTGGLTLLVILPWLIRLREGALLRIGGYFLSNNVGTEQFNDLPSLDAVLSFYAKHYLIALALLGVGLLTWQRNWRGLVLAGWVLLVWVAANPYLIGLNGAGIVTNFAVVIAAYIVLAPLAGIAIDGICARTASVVERFTSLAPRFIAYGQVMVGAVLLLWGVGWQQQIVTPATQLFTPADAVAMDWIKRETPPDAKFVVNSFAAYENTTYAGSDGGWWLPFMTGRQSNLPPITYGTEAGEQPDFQMSVMKINNAIHKYRLTSPKATAILREAGYSYLYDGPTAAGLPPGIQENIRPEILAHSPFYKEVYSKGGVTIWRLR